MHCHPVSRQSVYQFVFTHPARTSKELTDIAAGFFRRSTIRLTLPTGYTALPNCLQVLPPESNWMVNVIVLVRLKFTIIYLVASSTSAVLLLKNVNQLKLSNIKFTSILWTWWLVACTDLQNVRLSLETSSHHSLKNGSTKNFFQLCSPAVGEGGQWYW